MYEWNEYITSEFLPLFSGKYFIHDCGDLYEIHKWVGTSTVPLDITNIKNGYIYHNHVKVYDADLMVVIYECKTQYKKSILTKNSRFLIDIIDKGRRVRKIDEFLRCENEQQTK